MLDQLKVPEIGALLQFWNDSVRKSPEFESLFPFPAESRVETMGFDWVTPIAHRLSIQYRDIENMSPVTLDVIVALAIAQEEAWVKAPSPTTDTFLCSVYDNYFVVQGMDGLNRLVQVNYDAYHDGRDWAFVLTDHTNNEYEEPSCARFYTFSK